MSDTKKLTRSEWISQHQNAFQCSVDISQRAFDIQSSAGLISIDLDPPEKTPGEIWAENMAKIAGSGQAAIFDINNCRNFIIGGSHLLDSLRSFLSPWLDLIISDSEAAGAAKYLELETSIRKQIQRDAIAEGTANEQQRILYLISSQSARWTSQDAKSALIILRDEIKQGAGDRSATDWMAGIEANAVAKE